MIRLSYKFLGRKWVWTLKSVFCIFSEKWNMLLCFFWFVPWPLTLPVSKRGPELGSFVQEWGSGPRGEVEVNASSLKHKGSYSKRQTKKTKPTLFVCFKTTSVNMGEYSFTTEMSSMFIQKWEAPVVMVSRWERWQSLACWNCFPGLIHALCQPPLPLPASPAFP